MFDQILPWLEQYPYLGVSAVFILCGLGLPLPEEIVLLAAGYICAKVPDKVPLWLMMAWCAGSILVGDLVPSILGRVFGTRLLRVRWMRFLVTKQRLAMFDRWFRRRGDAVILVARFVPGLRMVAFFTAGAMKMPWRRFLLLDGLGIVLIVPLLTWLGFRSQGFIDEVIVEVQKVERGILWAAIGGGIVVGLWFWWWRRRRFARLHRKVGETFVQPSRPVSPSSSPDTVPSAAEPSAAVPSAAVPPPAARSEDPMAPGVGDDRPEAGA